MVASEQGQTATTAAGLQKLGGSRKPEVNLLLANQAMHSLWMPNQDLDAMWGVTLGLMRDIAPTDALEGMLTAQLVATHNLHMRCHKLAAETESPEKLKDYGNMAAKAGRSFCGLMTTLSRHRGKAPAQVRVGDVVNESGEPTAAHAPATTSGTVADEPPMRSAHPEANALQIATGSGKDPLPVHGGAMGSGAPTGNKNALKHGRYTAEAIALRRKFRALMRQNRQLIESR